MTIKEKPIVNLNEWVSQPVRINPEDFLALIFAAREEHAVGFELEGPDWAPDVHSDEEETEEVCMIYLMSGSEIDHDRRSVFGIALHADGTWIVDTYPPVWVDEAHTPKGETA